MTRPIARFRSSAALGLAAVLPFVTLQPAQAVDYVDAPPLADTIDASVRDCRSTDTLNVPLITWGADLATIYANGNAEETARGSLFDEAGLDIRLQRQDDFKAQVEAYLRCDSPFLRATMGMVGMVADIAQADPRTEMVAIYQLSWSNGGDALVVGSGVTKPEELAGRTIALQAYGPHVDYLMTVLNDAGLEADDVTLRWTPDLVGLAGNAPAAALHDDQRVDAAMVIIPDALALTSGGTVGDGSEDSVRGANILLSTRSASRVIADVYVVRADYLEEHRDEVQAFVHALTQAEEATRALMREGGGDRDALLTAGGDILLDAPDAIADTEALWADAETVGWTGNVRFFGDENYARGFERLVPAIQDQLVDIGLIASTHTLDHAYWDYEALSEGLSDTSGVEVPRFDTAALNQVVSQMQAQGNETGTLFSFEVHFRPNQDSFPIEVYREQFARVVELASTYAGAVITVEGHADPLGYLRAQQEGQSQVVLNRMVQSARNLSLQRANAVRDSIIAMAEADGMWLDRSQFVTLGLGFQDPNTGMCGADPCAPQTEEEWLSNMRVVFNIVQVEAEASVFTPLN